MVDAYYSQLAMAEAMLKTDHHFIFSCKGKLPLQDAHSAQAWVSLGLLSLDLVEAEAACHLLVQQEATQHLNELLCSGRGKPIPNYIVGYCSTLGYVDQANVFWLCYCFLH
jgi:hypothetical protein